MSLYTSPTRKTFLCPVIVEEEEYDKMPELVPVTRAQDCYLSPDSVGYSKLFTGAQGDSYQSVRSVDRPSKDLQASWQCTPRKTTVQDPPICTMSQEPSNTDLLLELAAMPTATTISSNCTAASSCPISSGDTVIGTDRSPRFHHFPRLPSGIRAIIWSLNMPGPRLVEVVEHNNNFLGAGKQVPNLYVCQESRLEALKTHPLSFSVNYDPPLIPFNFETDTLFLGLGLMDEQNHIYFRNNSHEEELAKVQRLMVDVELAWGDQMFKDKGGGLHQRDRGRGLCGISRLIFKGVKEYTALYTCLTDPLPYWADPAWFPIIMRHSRGWRYSGADPAEVYRFLKKNWCRLGVHENRYPIHPQFCEQQRYGGIQWNEKWEPAIKRWEIPKISTFGLDDEIIAAFDWSNLSSWAELVMDRAIEDMFY